MRRSLQVDKRAAHGSGRRTLLAIVALGGLVVTPGCGGEEPDDASSGSVAASSSDGTGRSSRTAKTPVDLSTTGTLSGVVRFEGAVPEPKFIKMVGETFCLQAHKEDDGGYFDDRLLVSDGRLRNAFVWVSSGLDGYEFQEPEGKVTLDQVGCLYTPRVVGLQLGQPVSFRNSDGTMHNVRGRPEKNRPWNIAMIKDAPPVDVELRREEVMIEVGCDVHAWMKSWIGAVDHPCFQVTGEDGSFRLEGVPPGELVLGVWHETLGTRDVPVTLEPSGDVVVDDVVFTL